MNKIISITKSVVFKSIADFFFSAEISALCQANPLTAVIATYFSNKYSQEQYGTLTTFVHLIHARLLIVEKDKIDIEFFDTQNGKRIIGKIFRGILRDNRIEKLQAMVNLTVNLYIKSKLTVDEKELYVDILDNLNSLQLSILQKAVNDIRNRTDNKHRGLGWELLAKEYEQKGISKALFLQSIRTLESSGIVNQNNAQIVEIDKTHFITDFGEQFCDFISNQLTKDSPYLLL